MECLVQALSCGLCLPVAERCLQVQAHCGQRRAQLVCSVGGQGAFGVQRVGQAAQQVVGTVSDGL